MQNDRPTHCFYGPAYTQLYSSGYGRTSNNYATDTTVVAVSRLAAVVVIVQQIR